METDKEAAGRIGTDDVTLTFVLFAWQHLTFKLLLLYFPDAFYRYLLVNMFILITLIKSYHVLKIF